LFLGERMSWLHAVAFPCALYGFALLSGLTGERLRGAWDPHLFGNLLMLVSLLGEAIYSVFARKLLVRREAIPIFGNAVVFGAIVLTCILIASAGLPNLFALTPRAWAALLWMGPVGTTGTYLYWMKVLPRASIPSMALTLFLQPVAGSLWGYLGLGERLAGPQLGGAALILLAVAAPLMERRVRSP
jgi:drug/metabolite transporter (DMT)-like permease